MPPKNYKRPITQEMIKDALEALKMLNEQELKEDEKNG